MNTHKNNLREYRENKFTNGISKAELARQIGVCRSYITMLEQGKIMPSMKLAFKIAKFFNCKIEDIFFKTG